MNINPDDPKWTAYVLGELDNAERVEMEQLLKSSEEARAIVDDLRFATAALKEEFGTESGAGLHPEQRMAVHAAAQPAHAWLKLPRVVWAAGGLAAAAALVFVLLPHGTRNGNITDSAQLISRQAGPVTSVPPAATGLPETTAPDPAPEKGSEQAPAVALVLPSLTASPAPQSVDTATLSLAAAKSVAPEPASSIFVQNGVLGGTVSDTTGARIPGVRVTATNRETGMLFTAVTNSSGTYQFVTLPAGLYDVKAELPGFQTLIATSLAVNASSQARQNFELPVGTVTSVAEVTSSADSSLKTAASSIGTVLPTPERASVATGSGGGVARTGVFAGALAGVIAENRIAAPPSVAPGLPVLPPRPDVLRQRPGLNTETYDRIVDNAFMKVTQDPLATMSIDVDTAAYSNLRRFLTTNQRPPQDSVRIEEMINYFSYDYPQPSGPHPIGAQMEVAAAPWNPDHRLVRVGIKARDMDVNRRPVSNLVFLIDVSGSMQPAERLPLLREAMRMLVGQLSENDRVAMVVYAGSSGVVLTPTTGDRKDVILRAIDNLQAGGSTNGASGIQLAYNLAAQNYIRGGVNRVILATDGDFNVGITNQGDLLRLIEDKAKTGVFLSVLGFGMGNLKDSTLEKLADSGNGNYAYIDTMNEAKKVLVDQMSSTFVTVAKDVKIQIEFNPAQVEAYRLIGYENRVLAAQDFNNDLKDAGDMGAGHTVTALFEVVPRGMAIPGPSIDPLRYQGPPPQPAPARSTNSTSREMLTLKVRYKEPEGSQSKLLEVPLVDQGGSFARASVDYRFAAAVAEFGMVLRDSPYKGTSTLASALDIASGSRGNDRSGYRQEFIGLVRRAQAILGSNRR